MVITSKQRRNDNFLPENTVLNQARMLFRRIRKHLGKEYAWPMIWQAAVDEGYMPHINGKPVEKFANVEFIPIVEKKKPTYETLLEFYNIHHPEETQ